MTAAAPAGTPLILIVLSLGISFLAAMGSIAAVLMARANLQRQIQVAAREAWMREFREQVAALVTSTVIYRITQGIADNLEDTEMLSDGQTFAR